MNRLPAISFRLKACALAAAVTLASSPTPAEIPESAADVIPPLHRAERHFANGETYLLGLKNGTRIEIERSDGCRFELRLEDGKLKTDLPASQLSENEQIVTTPLGYKIFRDKVHPRGSKTQMLVQAPSGARTQFIFSRKMLVATEGDGHVWTRRAETVSLRLADGTLIDVNLKNRAWTISTLHGERFREKDESGRWQTLPTLPSPPLVPSVWNLFLGGDGNDWRRPAQEEHLAFAWSWYPWGLDLVQAVDDVREGLRREDLDFFFNGIARLQPPAEAGGYLLGRRLALGGGDRITFRTPDGTEAERVYLLPGPAEPNYVMLDSKLPTSLSPTDKANPR